MKDRDAQQACHHGLHRGEDGGLPGFDAAKPQSIAQEGDDRGNERGEHEEEQRAERRGRGEKSGEHRRGAADTAGADGGDQKRAGRDRVRGVAPQGDAAEDAVKTVTEPRAEAEKEPARRKPAAPDAGDQHAAAEGHGEREQLRRRKLFAEEQGGEERDPDGGGIEQDRRRGQRHDLDGGEIANGEKQDARKAEPEKERQVAQPDAALLRGTQDKEQQEKERGEAEPSCRDLKRIEAKSAEPAHKETHAAPQDPCEQNEEKSAVEAVLFFHHTPSEEKRGKRARETAPPKKDTRKRVFFWRRHPDLNRGIADLQSAALPLGYGAI